MKSAECSFCDPDSYSERVIASNGLAIALLSSPRMKQGHSLVIPRRHVELPSELLAEEVNVIFRLVGPLHKRMLATIATGVDVWQKSRPQVGQNDIKMDHVHFHVLPSQPGDPLYDQALVWSRDQFTLLDATERTHMLTVLDLSQDA